MPRQHVLVVLDGSSEAVPDHFRDSWRDNIPEARGRTPGDGSAAYPAAETRESQAGRWMQSASIPIQDAPMTQLLEILVSPGGSAMHSVRTPCRECFLKKAKQVWQPLEP
jgi:hypothetical protein